MVSCLTWPPSQANLYLSFNNTCKDQKPTFIRLDLTGVCKVMEPISNVDSIESSRDEKLEAVDLLEECWFFDNLLKRRTQMLRCNSDPCTSSKFSQEIKKLPENGVVHCNKLIRAPSLPPCIGRKEDNNVREKESKKGRNKLTRQSSHQSLLQASKPSCAEKKEVSQEKGSSIATRNKLMINGQSSHRSLLRTPSLPPYIGRSEDIDQDRDSDARMSRLIQQAFANSSDIFHHQQTSKGMTQTQSFNIPRYRPPRNLEVESNNTTGINEMNRRYGLNQGKLRKSQSDLESEEVQGFKDLGFTFDKKDLSSSVVDILPGLQEKAPEELNHDTKMRRPYLSEAWLVQSCAPPVPNWVTKNSAEDMKAQIKFWARAVASNLRVQEC